MKGRRRSRSKKSKKSEDVSHSQPIPDEFSIDQLLLTREQDVLFSQQNETSDAEEDEQPALVELEPNKSIMEYSQGNFPMRVFDEISSDSANIVRCVPMLKQWEWTMFKYNIEDILTSTTTFLSLIQQLIIIPSDEVGHVIIKCIKALPKNSIPYQHWYEFMKEGVHTSIQSAVYLLSVSSFDMFIFETQEQERNAHIDIILLHAAAILCPLVSEHPAYGNALKALKYNLCQEELFDSDDIQRISSFISDAAMDVPVGNLKLFTTMWPFDGIGKSIMYHAGLMTCCLLASVTDVGFDSLIASIKCIKKICDHTESYMDRPSVILGLAEKVVIAGVKLEQIDQEMMKSVILSLKFTVSGTLNDQMLQPAFIKEQIHVTRSHLENISQFVFKS